MILSCVLTANAMSLAPRVFDAPITRQCINISFHGEEYQQNIIINPWGGIAIKYLDYGHLLFGNANHNTLNKTFQRLSPLIPGFNEKEQQFRKKLQVSGSIPNRALMCPGSFFAFFHMTIAFNRTGTSFWWARIDPPTT